MVSSMNQFDIHVKELLWHKEKWESNFQKASQAANSLDDVETLKNNLRRMRAVLDNCENSLLFESGQQWDQSAVRKASIKSISDINGSGTLLTSNSSSERSSNGSPFQFASGDGLMGSGAYSSASLGNDDFYDPLNTISDILTENHDVLEPTSSMYSLSESTSSLNFGAPVNGTNQTASYWPSTSAWSTSSSTPLDMFSAFSSSPKPSFAAVAQLPAVTLPDTAAQIRKSSDASSPPTVAKSGPVIAETPLYMNLQKPHLAKIIYVFPLNYKMDESVLEKYFSQFGKVAKTKIFRYPNGASKTAGIVEFEDASSALMALKKKYHHVDGCQIESKPFEPKTSDLANTTTTQGLVSRSSHFVNNTEFQVFVGGIPATATDEDIEKAITVFGKVKKIQVNPNGTFAFVSFATESDASKIVGVHSINIGGKLVECKRNQPQTQRSRANTSDSNPPANIAVSPPACQFCKKPKVKALLTCDHRVDCFECVKSQRVCPKCGGKLDLSKEPAKHLSSTPS
ncbi:uncharacterized protein LOC129583576 [Paramacrobiotus metropolitanus]|uniref:uncharacterized protein LOC129583576 n=1 Tax=Paramacrobiotus metropolitanus TaxID=2943436 RepID=UPI002445AF64|nr:uncharacterized protein LOC129583576 [Paramacrobiotus metropolitanus]